MNEHYLPFGKHKGRPLPAVPTGYLEWISRETKLSSGLRSAVAAELKSRGLQAPAPLPPRPANTCFRCGPAPGVTLRWLQDALGRRRIRATCNHCHQMRDHPSVVPPYTTEADANASPTPILDALTRLEALGVEVQSDGRRAWLRWEDMRRVPADLVALVRQCSHTLAGMLGATRR
jgi:uncharacterized protein (DUF3820 family)